MQPRYIGKRTPTPDVLEFEAKSAGSDLDIRFNDTLVAFFNGHGELFLCDFYKNDKNLKELQERGIQFMKNPNDDDTVVIKIIFE